MTLIEVVNEEGRRLRVKPERVGELRSAGYRPVRPEDVPPVRKRKAFLLAETPTPDVGELGDLCILPEQRLCFGPKSAAGWGEPFEFVEMHPVEGEMVEVEPLAPPDVLRPGDAVQWVEKDQLVSGEFLELKDKDTAIVLKDKTKNPREVALEALITEGV